MFGGPGDGVLPETRERLILYEAILRRWQKAHNLVSASTLPELWTRHFADSWQLGQLAPLDCRWLDIGSGAGFPGVVVALAMRQSSGSGHVELVETNPRKLAFLREVVRETGAPASVHAIAIEKADHLHALDIGVVTARAFADLARLCGLAKPFVDKGAVALFPKGQDIDAELTEATKYWNIKYHSFPSRTAADSAILLIEGLSRRD